jgi:nucleotidyltransferase substrate binding protein (TIGR01987 family)
MSIETNEDPRLENFSRALAMLRQAVSREPDSLSPLEKEGAVRRFEFCLDQAWKAAKDFLEDSGLTIAPVTPRETLLQAALAGIVADNQVWIDMFNHRNLLAHNYDGVVVAEVTYALTKRYFRAIEQLHGCLAAQFDCNRGSA